MTISKPLRDFITGGGYLVNEDSAGIYAGDLGAKTNFGFNIKFNKQLKNLIGKFNGIIRQGDQVYQIKSNAATSLVTNPYTGQAEFISKANLNNVTDPDAVVSLGGNLTLHITLADNGEPGASVDSIGISLWKSNELWFSSNWDGASTVEQLLDGGNIQVHTFDYDLSPGDMNADSLVNMGDVAPFVQALVNPATFAANHRGVNADVTGDVDTSGTFDLGDLGAFPSLFVGAAAASSTATSSSGSGATAAALADMSFASSEIVEPDVDPLVTDLAFTSDDSDDLLLATSDHSNYSTASDELELLAQLDQDWTDADEDEWDEVLLEVLDELLI